MDPLPITPTLHSAWDHPHIGFDCLPREIICDILLKSLPPLDELRSRDHEVEDDLDKYSITTPLYISHVCQYWRKVSLSLGELWSYLCIDSALFENDDENTWRSAVEIMDTWLERTNGCPLNYTIRLFPNSSENAHTSIERMIITLISRQRQWGDVDYMWFSLHLSREFPGVILDDMTVLTSLSLRFDLCECDDKGKCGCSRINITRSPEHRRLHLHGCGDFKVETGEKTDSLSTEPGTFESDLSNVPAWRLCLHFLKNAPKLEKLNAGLCGYLTSFRSSEEDDMVIPGLQCLYLDDGPELDENPSLSLYRNKFPRETAFYEALALVLRKLTLPGLRVLSFKYGEGEILLSFLKRSLPPLTRLHVGFCLAEDLLIPILGLLPALNDLRLRCPRIPTQLLQALTVHEHTVTGRASAAAGSGILCPKLQSLRLRSLQFEGGRRTCVDALVTMLLSRCEILGTFRTVTIYDRVDTEGDMLSITTSQELKQEALPYFRKGRTLLVEGDDPPPRSFQTLG